MTTNPNAIIRALLDIAQAAYVLVHSPSKETGDNLRRNMALLEELPQYCNNPVNGPCRARKYLESFLVGQHIVGEVADFEPAQEWKAPVDAPAFKPSADFPSSGPISHDFYTHRDSWRKAIQQLADTSPTSSVGATDEAGYWRHELRAFDRAFASLPPEGERRTKPSLDLPTIPVVGKDALIEATRPLFEKAMKSHGYIAEINALDMYEGFTEYRWEGWSDAVKTMGFKPPVDVIADMKARLALPDGDEARVGPDAVLMELMEIDRATMLKDPGARAAGGEYEHPVFGRVLVIGCHPYDGAARICETVIDDQSFYFLTDRSTLKPADGESKWPYIGLSETSEKTLIENMRTNMLADTADEANKIINDAGLLKNFVELFTMRDPGVTMLKVYEAAHCDNSMPWNISVYVENKVMRNYRSTSLHQAIVKAHKGEQDHEYPEPDTSETPTWDMSASMPLSIMPATAVVGISTAPAEPTITDSPRRQEMNTILLTVRDKKSIALAKRIVSEVAKVTKMADIPDDKIEDVIRASELELK